MKNDLMIFERRKQAVVSSVVVSKAFNREHKSGLKTIYGENCNGKHEDGLIDGIRSGGNSPDLYFIKS